MRRRSNPAAQYLVHACTANEKAGNEFPASSYSVLRSVSSRAADAAKRTRACPWFAK